VEKQDMTTGLKILSSSLPNRLRGKAAAGAEHPSRGSSPASSDAIAMLVVFSMDMAKSLHSH